MTSTKLGFAALAIFTAPLTLAADPGWYFGGSGGPSQTDVDEDRIAADLLGQGFATTSMDDNERDTGFKAFGGYQFNKYFSLEAATTIWVISATPLSPSRQELCTAYWE